MHNPQTMSKASNLITAEEFATLPDDDYRYELVEGRVGRVSPPGFRHGRIALSIGALLRAHVKARRLGEVAVESGFTLARDPDTVRGPDVSFVRQERIPPGDLPRGFWEGPPDLAIEVMSPDNRGPALRRKVDDYLTRGAMAVVVIDPDTETMTVHQGLLPPRALQKTDELDLDDVVEGFRCRVGDVFD